MTTPECADDTAGVAPDGSQRAQAGDRPVDVLILTALQDELAAVLALGEGGRARWEERKDQKGFRCYRRAFPNGRGGALAIAAAWSGEMGDRTAALRAQQLVEELSPACVAMCGICAGYRKKVSLGDVIMAEQIYAYDEGKIVAAPEVKPEMLHSLRTFDLHATWKMDASYLARELDLSGLASARPPSKEAQRRWLLRALLDHEGKGEPAPAAHPDRKRECPSWTATLKAAVKEGLVAMKGGSLRLTDAGRESVEEDKLLHPDGPPADPPFRIHVGAMGTGTAVQEDPELFERLRRLVRTTLGVEMEAVAIGDVAALYEKRAIVIKAVSDHADQDKDDSFREFACRASAEVLLAFLLKHVEPTVAAEDDDGELIDDGEDEGDGHDRRSLRGDRDPHGARSLRADRGSSFLDRVARVATVREGAGAVITKHRAPPPFAGVLEIAARDGALSRVSVVGALEQPISEALVMQYINVVERRYRTENPLVSSTLVHVGEQASQELAQRAWRQRVELKSFAVYQGIIDFGSYLEKQTARLEKDDVYPPSLYVEQPARVSLAGRREEERTERALEALTGMLDSPHSRFVLVLGDFGAGKTFLLRELARRMHRGDYGVVPVLVEMRQLQKQRSLRALLAQHFADADVGRIELDAFQYMLGEGRIALLFDGFDELALRLTYDRALEHFETVIAAAQGNAKVVVTSRTQHFLTDQQVRMALAEKAERVPGYRLFQLEKFGETQIRQFLTNKINAPDEVEERYQLLHDVKDLLGLSKNPRMLAFIAKIELEKLREAKKKTETITAAALYQILITEWLEAEWKRIHPEGAPPGILFQKLSELVTALACVFWERNEESLALGEFRGVLVADGLEPSVVEFMIGSGSLLVRDAEGRFSFVHRSVMEWLVAAVIARDVKEKGDAAALGICGMSELMADFFISLAGRDIAERWAYDVGRHLPASAAKMNAARVLNRLNVIVGSVMTDLSGQDLRGTDWSGVDWRGAKLDGADLRSATLVGAKLGGASLVKANLSHANLEMADLTGVDLAEVDLSFARLLGADLRGVVHQDAANVRGAMLVGAKGVTLEAEALAVVGAVPPSPRECTPMWMLASPCNTVAWSPSGDLVASGHHDGSVRVCDAVSGLAIRTMYGHLGPTQSVAFSPKGKTLASASDDGTIRLWDVSTARGLRALYGHSNGVTSVAFGPEGKALASASDDGTIRLWDVSSGRELRAFHGHSGRVKSVAFSPDGKTLASVSDDGTIRLWDVSTGRERRAFHGRSGRVTGVTFSPDGKTLASASYDGTIRLWDVATARELRAFKGHSSSVTSVAFSPDGKTLASASEDKALRLWDVATAREPRTFHGHSNSVTSVAFSPDGKTLASASEDNTLRFWDVSAARELRAFHGHSNWVMSVAFSPDGKTLASVSEDTTLRLWDVATARELRSFHGHSNEVTSVAFSRDGKTLASASEDKTLRLWDVSTARQLRAFHGHSSRVTSVAFSPDGKTLASGSYDGTVRLWDVAAARELRAFHGHSSRVTSVTFSLDGRTLASASEDTTLRLWDVATARELRAFRGHSNWVMSVAFSPDGKTLVSACCDNTLRLWDVATARELRAFLGHSNWVMSVAFSHDGRTLVSASYDSTVRLWDVATARELRAFLGHSDWVRSVAFSHDGKTLASASYDSTVRLWDVATTRCLAILLSAPEGWVAFTPDGRYKLGGDIAGSFWHVIGLCRFEPGELDPYLPHLHVPDDAPLFALP